MWAGSHDDDPGKLAGTFVFSRDWHASSVAEAKIKYKISTNAFVGHRTYGEEFFHSPHKNLGCYLCHDPHKSVWKHDGGVKYADQAGGEKAATEGGIGNMCRGCHEHKNKRVRGSMGELGLECVECHMPEVSSDGHRPAHLFRISREAVAAKDNGVWTGETDANGNPIDTNWWNIDASGDALLTLDLACNTCHNNMSIEQLAKAAKGIHRQPGLVDLTVNNADALQIVSKNDNVSVDFSVKLEELVASNVVNAQWWVICQGPRGWQSWDGRKWKAGFKPWRKSASVIDIELQNVLNSKLKPGFYTYWVRILPMGGSERHVDSVPVFVTR